MVIDEKQRERLRDLTVDVLLEVRASYLGTAGANVLKHWDMIQDRLRSAARTSANAEQWLTSVSRSLKLPAPSVRFSDSTLALTGAVRELKCEDAWLSLLEEEYGYLMATARAVSEQRKAKKEAANV